MPKKEFVHLSSGAKPISRESEMSHQLVGHRMKADDAKRRLVEESVRLIEEKGLGALSFREVARRAGLSHQAPYHHFANREGILAAIALEGFTNLDAALVAARRAKRGKPQKVLQAVMRAYVTFALDHPVYFRVMFRPELVPLRRHPAAFAQAQLSFQRLADSVAECHPGVKKTGRRLLEVVNAMWAAAHGLAILWVDGPIKVNSQDLSLPSLVEVATEIFSEAGASAKRLSQKTNGKLPAARTVLPGTA
jgi:AcrR family transcriptional regulator